MFGVFGAESQSNRAHRPLEFTAISPLPAIDRKSRNRHVTPMLIYKIFRAAEWAEFDATGTSGGAPIDLADGYIHFSTGAQVAQTARKYFAGCDDLVLLALQADALGDALKWELARGGARFPHLYRALQTRDVEWHAALSLGTDGHDFPKGVA